MSADCSTVRSDSRGGSGAGERYVLSAAQKGRWSMGEMIHEQTAWPGHGRARARPWEDRGEWDDERPGGAAGECARRFGWFWVQSNL